MSSNVNLTYGKNQIEWCRAKVLELSSQGHNQHEIAQTLQVSKGTVNSDLGYIRKKAQENLQHHIHETVPEEYQKCMTGMKRNLKQTLEIAETVSDPRVKLQARAIASDCYKYIMELTTNGVVVTDAIKYVNGKMEHLNNQEKKLLQDIKEDAEAEAKAEDNGLSENSEIEGEEEQQTHNGVFRILRATYFL